MCEPSSKPLLQFQPSALPLTPDFCIKLIHSIGIPLLLSITTNAGLAHADQKGSVASGAWRAFPASAHRWNRHRTRNVRQPLGPSEPGYQ